MDIDHGRLSRLRRGQGEVANHVIDEYAAGRLSRRDFLRRGAVVGISLPVLGAVISACGGSTTTTPSSSGGGGGGAAGATIKAGIVVPTAAINPVTVADQGGLDMLGQTGEYLTFSNQHLTLQPALATSWTPNSKADVWTFKIRQGVKFHNGHPLTADDVVYTFQEQANPKNAGNALSTFAGVLKPDGVVKVDSSTVAFHLEGANGNFPYLVSNDNYNSIIVPKGTDFAKWNKTFIGTGPFKLKSYTTNVGANFEANPDYWGGAPNLDSTQFTFYSSQQPQILALQGGTVDVIVQFVVQGAQALLSGGSYNIIKLKSSLHRELSMRNDQSPFTDKRVRQAVALTLDRPGMVQALLQGLGQVGNDSPFAPKFPSTNTSVPQRTKDLTKAKQLLEAAGHGSGFSSQLATEEYEEIPQLAQVIAEAASKIGVKINLKVESQANYYGKATFGNSDWLDAPMSLVDYGDRGVPNVFLGAPLLSDGTWNAAHFKNPTYDNLVKQYTAAVDLQTQQQIAGKIQTLLLDETPLIIPYFLDGLTATTQSVKNVNPTATAAIFLHGASKSA